MKKGSVVCVVLLLLALMVSCAYSQSSENSSKSDDSKRRIVTVKTVISTTPIVKGKRGEEKIINSPIFSTYEGNEAKISIGTAIPQGNSGETNVETALSLIPTINKDGNVCLTGSLKLALSGYKAQDIKISVTVEPGKSQELPIVMIPAAKGKNSLELTLTITATVQDPPKEQPKTQN